MAKNKSSKRPTVKEVNGGMMLNRQAMVNIDNYHRQVSAEIIDVFSCYLDFKKDRKKFEKFMQDVLAKRKKDQENKAVTAKEKSEVPEK
jgi:hypothetical protein